jgi:hypothetical protein
LLSLSTKVSDRFDSKSLVGIECPGEILYSIGVDPMSHVYTNIMKNANPSLLLNDPPFENIEDAMLELFKIFPSISVLDSNLSSFPSELRPLVMIFVPHPIRFDRIDVVDNHYFRNNIEPLLDISKYTSAGKNGCRHTN